MLTMIHYNSFLKSYIALNFSRILDKTYDGKTLKDKYLCLMTYTLYGLMFWKMPQFSGYMPFHLEYTKYIRALRNHQHGVEKSQEYINRCMGVWTIIYPIYTIFNILGFESLFKMSWDDRTNDNFGNHYLIKAIACSNGDIDNVIPFLTKNNPNIAGVKEWINCQIDNVKNESYSTPPLLLNKFECEQASHIIDKYGLFDDTPLSHSVILGYDEITMLLIAFRANPTKLVAFECSIIGWATATKNIGIWNFLNYASGAYHKEHYHADDKPCIPLIVPFDRFLRLN
jgi:hypothetical protein